jgi:hypothetical protein
MANVLRKFCELCIVANLYKAIIKGGAGCYTGVHEEYILCSKKSCTSRRRRYEKGRYELGSGFEEVIGGVDVSIEHDLPKNAQRSYEAEGSDISGDLFDRRSPQ